MREFRRSLPMSLLRAREAVMRNFIPHLREHDLSPQQWRVLRALYDTAQSDAPDIEMTTLAERCFLLMPSLSRIVQFLDKRGLVKRRISEHDQRRSLISITEDGIKLVNLMAPQSEARYQRITDAFGYGKLELLYELLDELTEKLNQGAAEQESRTELKDN
ncbi:MAG: homoprotocatechuate degradation operon regulator HpaR [Pseudomonadales bacterium]|nr:homoprotocatechuate degradation operon regulator HpaR [Pseudomonadales bacterium]